MKQISFIIFLFFSCFGLAQEKLTLDEVTISSNYTDANFLTDFNPEFGVGFGLHHVFRKNKNMNFIIGVDYNNINYSEANFFKYPNHISKKRNVAVNLHSIVFPILFKFNLGKTVFINTGLLINISVFKIEKGEEFFFQTYESKPYKTYSFGFSPTPGLVCGLGVNYNIFNQHFFSLFNYSLYLNSNYYSRSISNYSLSLGIKLKS